VEVPKQKSIRQKREMGFKAPDGKEFETRAEWRDYMMNEFYSFKNKKDEAEPLMKKVPNRFRERHQGMNVLTNSPLLHPPFHLPPKIAWRD